MAPPTTVPGCWPCTNVSSRASLASTRTSLEHASSRLHSGRFPTRHPHPPSHLLHIVLLLTLHLISFTLSFSSPSFSSPSPCPSPHPPSHLLHLALLLTLHLISFTLSFSSPSISSLSHRPSPHPPSHLLHIVLLLTLLLISFTFSFSSPSISSRSASRSWKLQKEPQSKKYSCRLFSNAEKAGLFERFPVPCRYKSKMKWLCQLHLLSLIHI